MDPLASCPDGVDVLEEFADALEEQQQRGERDDALEGIDDGTPRARVGGLADRPGVGELLPAEVEEQDHCGEEEEEISDRISLGRKSKGQFQMNQSFNIIT